VIRENNSNLFFFIKPVFCKCVNLLILTFFVVGRTCSQKTKELKFAATLCFNFHFKDWDQNMIYVWSETVRNVFQINAKDRYSKLFHDAGDRFYTSNFRGGMLCYAISVVIVRLKGLNESTSLLFQCHRRILYLKN